jgi:transglutaminase-like putative cysteine protease
MTGKVLETRVGGFFVARLEPKEQAKNLDYEHDILASAVVPVPRVISFPERIDHLSLIMTGFGDQLPPASDRQKVRVQADGLHLELSRDPPPPKSPFAIAHGRGNDPDVQPTPFVQSEAPEIRAAAVQAVGDASDAFTASTRLVHFVRQHIRDEYVPSYSNALEALRSARGDCTEHSVLYVGLARAVGLPSRMAVGIAYWPPAKGFGWHAWDEVKIAGKWVAVDPTWDQPIADATHLKLAAGDPAEQARIVMLLGRLKVIDERHSPAD